MSDKPEGTPEGTPQGAQRQQAAARDNTLPHIDFTTFVMSLAESVLIHLGELSAPEEAARANLAMAKQTIDMLGMLEEKTRGNLNDEETRLLQHLLFDLRLKFVEARKLG